MSPDIKRDIRQDSSPEINRQVIPQVLRNERGRIRWTLPGNSNEENLLLGIRNMQGLFLEKFPEFLVGFPLDKDGRIIESSREEARAFLSERVSDKQSFRDIFGSSYNSRVSTPYFEGSKTKALQMSFSPLGLNFNLGIPYQLDDTETKWVTLRSLQKQLGIEYKTMLSHLNNVTSRTGKGMNGHEVVFYSDKEARQRLERFFDQVNLPKANRGTGGTLEYDGKKWVTLRGLQSRFGMKRDTLSLILGSVPTTTAVSSTRREMIFYSESEAIEQINNFLSLPHIDSKNGFYTDEKGVIWASAKFLSRKLKISQNTIRSRLQNMPFMEARNEKGRKVILYHEVEARQMLENLSSLVHITSESGRYVDAEGASWINFGFILSQIRNNTGLRITLADIRSIKVRGGGNGKETTFYDELQVRDRLKDLLALPQINEQTRVYIDQEGQRWVTVQYFITQLGIGRSTLLPYLEGVNCKEVSLKRQGKTVLYREHEVSERLQNFLRLPRVDRKTGKYVDEIGESWVSVSYFTERGFDRSTILNRLGNTRSLMGRDKVNRETLLYSELDITRELSAFSVLPKVDKVTGIYTDEQHEEWINLGELVNISKRGYKTTLECLIDVRTIIGRDKTGRQATLYNRGEAIRILRENGIINEEQNPLNIASPEEEFLTEYEQRLLDGEIISYEEFMNMKGRQR